MVESNHQGTATFQSTPSGGKATATPEMLNRKPVVFQSTPSGGKATADPPEIAPPASVSIHAFRGEGDLRAVTFGLTCTRFNPRLPGGRRPGYAASAASVRGFNPRLPGGRRRGSRLHFHSRCGFNPRLPGGRRPTRLCTSICSTRFQSTPSGGKATMVRSHVSLSLEFQSTPSGGKATGDVHLTVYRAHVSIHAFRGEGDSKETG